MDLVVLDMGMLSFVARPSSLTCLSPLGETLASLPRMDFLTPQEEVALLLDHALTSARLVRFSAEGVRTRGRLGLYNPYSGEIAVSALPKTQSFTSGKITFNPEGFTASLQENKLILSDGSVISETMHSATSLSRVHESHRV